MPVDVVRCRYCKSSGEKIQFKGHCGADPWETDVQCVFILGPKLQSDGSLK